MYISWLGKTGVAAVLFEAHCEIVVMRCTRQLIDIAAGRGISAGKCR